MVTTTEKTDVLIRNGGAVICQGGDGITYIEHGIDIFDFDGADVWKVVEDPYDYSMSVVHVGDHP